MRSRQGRRRLALAAACLASVAAGTACTAPAAPQPADTARPADAVPTDIPEELMAPPATSLTGQGDAEPGEGGARATKWGPLSAADQDLIRKVRLATLWEMTIAQEAIQRGDSARVREISREISAQHHDLDEKARDLAQKLDVRLPVRPTEDQQRWMADISGRSGRDYDVTYVKWLRLAHGQIFGLIGQVRGSTQNTLVRTFAETCNAAVLNHQRLLESTGLAGPEAFPDPPEV
ncbi:DUF4142 domain-containing protein [Nonomuraea sp. MCN248]|uniref:DUF4142 domain-containing protein n=1 Tax=Nonomuraea corallina TaxID=2989783 RepID=A0ABT4SK25_9ACTN|nr:DUF4142 domain-containing protein [Nonomuraea corallina]MDA0637566.1 DUF4142 domain-containing protein [Nonomuraea corallina]